MAYHDTMKEDAVRANLHTKLALLRLKLELLEAYCELAESRYSLVTQKDGRVVYKLEWRALEYYCDRVERTLARHNLPALPVTPDISQWRVTSDNQIQGVISAIIAGATLICEYFLGLFADQDRIYQEALQVYADISPSTRKQPLVENFDAKPAIEPYKARKSFPSALSLSNKGLVHTSTKCLRC
jgi:hypothetical protein